DDLALVEHLLGERAPPLRARDRDRAHVMQPGADSTSEVDDVTRAVDVGRLVLLLGRLEVVDGGEMEQVGAAHPVEVFGGPTESRPHDVADDRTQSAACTERVDERLETLPRTGPDEHIGRALAARKEAEELAPDEPGPACD